MAGSVQQQEAPKKAAPSWQGFQNYLKGVRHELRAPQTHWPDRAEMIRLTQVVLFVIAAVAIYCGGMDFILAQLTTRLLPHR